MYRFTLAHMGVDMVAHPLGRKFAEVGGSGIFESKLLLVHPRYLDVLLSMEPWAAATKDLS